MTKRTLVESDGGWHVVMRNKTPWLSSHIGDRGEDDMS